MSIKNINLDKVLKAFFLRDNELVTLLRTDIRAERDKALGHDGRGGNFYLPFWSDAKNHMRGVSDLRVETADRIEKNRRRERLYEPLRDGFLNWWDNRRRWSNLEFNFEEFSALGHYEFEDLGATVKVENLAALAIGEEERRLIYPYPYEEPLVDESMARLGLWLMSKALPDHNPNDMRILDIHRSNSISVEDHPLRGTEEDEFRFHYKRIIDRWEKLREEY